jgi:hypothetical protein
MQMGSFERILQVSSLLPPVNVNIDEQYSFAHEMRKQSDLGELVRTFFICTE